MPRRQRNVLVVVVHLLQNVPPPKLSEKGCHRTGQGRDFCVNLQIFQKLAAQFKSNAISVKQSFPQRQRETEERGRQRERRRERQLVRERVREPVDNFIYLQLATVYIN